MFKYLRKIAEETPPERDRYIDFLRVFSILVVVIGHWLSAIVEYDVNKDSFRLFNAVGITPLGWLFTWLFQVMPIFFFVGGFSNMVSFESFIKKGKSVKEYIKIRTARLLKPTLFFLLLWTCGFVIFKIIPLFNVPLKEIFLILKKLWI